MQLDKEKTKQNIHMPGWHSATICNKVKKITGYHAGSSSTAITPTSVSDMLE